MIIDNKICTVYNFKYNIFKKEIHFAQNADYHLVLYNKTERIDIGILMGL